MGSKDLSTCLLILDGWGLGSAGKHNAITSASTPNIDRLMATSPMATLQASGPAVGLPRGQMGNSEVGHLHIAAGRCVKQDLCRINDAIACDQFNQCKAILNLKKQTIGHSIHIIGLYSHGGVHASCAHIHACIDALDDYDGKIMLHMICDGRDVPVSSACADLEHLLNRYAKSNRIHLASIAGRYYAMDRDCRWDRTKSYLHCLNEANITLPHDTLTLIKTHRAAFSSDEFVKPLALYPHGGLHPEDGIILANFRADRMRQLTWALTGKFPENIAIPNDMTIGHHTVVTMTDYPNCQVSGVCFAKPKIDDTLGDVIANAGLKQMRIAETEKYAHVTFFFNGNCHRHLPHESRIMLDSPNVATYDLAPQMNVSGVVDAIIKTLKSGAYDFVIANIANADMVGHTGNLEATIKAIESIDEAIGRLALYHTQQPFDWWITADHGNADMMWDLKTNSPLTSHTHAPVMLLYHGPKKIKLQANGSLTNIAPTIIDHHPQLTQPEIMDAISLLMSPD